MSVCGSGIRDDLRRGPRREGECRFEWPNVINVEADQGTTERALIAAFYGKDHDWDNAGWRDMASFSSCVLRPLEWAGLLAETRETHADKHVHHVFKTPLWRNVLKLDTDAILKPVKVQ